MSSTSVHSNNYCASAQMIPTESQVEIPPKNAKPGPTKYEVEQNVNVLEIQVEENTIDKDGIARDQNGGKMGKLSFETCLDNKEIRAQRAPHKYKGREEKIASKGESR